MKSRYRLSIIYTYMIGLLGVLIIGCWALIAASQTIWRVDSNTTTIIDTHSVCIGYSAPDGKNVFIPARTASEYQSFRSNALISPNIVNCTYSWTTSAYGSCSLTCGGGAQSRTVQCKRHDGTIVADSYCAGTKPAVSQSCNTQACAIPVNGVCGSTANSCTSGNTSGYSAGSCGGSQTWSCVGSGGGGSASCNIANVACVTTGRWVGRGNTGWGSFSPQLARVVYCNATIWCIPLGMPMRGVDHRWLSCSPLNSRLVYWDFVYHATTVTYFCE